MLMGYYCQTSVAAVGGPLADHAQLSRAAAAAAAVAAAVACQDRHHLL